MGINHLDRVARTDANNVESRGIGELDVLKMVPKRKRKARSVHRSEEQPPEDVAAQDVPPTQEVAALQLAATGTPSRQTITLPAILQDSPVPVTRSCRRLTMAIAEDASQQSQPSRTTYASPAKPVDMPETSKSKRAKKLTPKKKKKL